MDQFRTRTGDVVLRDMRPIGVEMHRILAAKVKPSDMAGLTLPDRDVRMKHLADWLHVTIIIIVLL